MAAFFFAAAEKGARVKALVILPSNLGDVLLTLPSLELVKTVYPQVTFLCSQAISRIIHDLCPSDDVVIYRKDFTWAEKCELVETLTGKFKACVDFKHTLIPYLIGAGIRTAALRLPPPRTMHQKDIYEALVRSMLKLGSVDVPRKKFEMVLNGERQRLLDGKVPQGAVCLMPSARSRQKRYPAECFSYVVSRLKDDFPVVVMSLPEDRGFVDQILQPCGQPANIIDLTGETDFADLFYILSERAGAVVCCDSGPLHLASYVDVPTVAIFGPTDPVRYGPYASQRMIVQNPGNKPVPPGHLPYDWQLPPHEVVGAVYELMRHAAAV